MAVGRTDLHLVAGAAPCPSLSSERLVEWAAGEVCGGTIDCLDQAEVRAMRGAILLTVTSRTFPSLFVSMQFDQHTIELALAASAAEQLSISPHLERGVVALTARLSADWDAQQLRLVWLDRKRGRFRLEDTTAATFVEFTVPSGAWSQLLRYGKPVPIVGGDEARQYKDPETGCLCVR